MTAWDVIAWGILAFLVGMLAALVVEFATYVDELVWTVMRNV